jgi:hypothetical protein
MDAVQRETAQGGRHDHIEEHRTRDNALSKEEYCPLFFREISGYRRSVSYDMHYINHDISIS